MVAAPKFDQVKVGDQLKPIVLPPVTRHQLALYCGGSGGIWILDAKGKKLGRIVHGQPQTTNLAFGGADWKTLYFTNARFLGSVNLKIAGTPVPASKKG